jgi:hypothetical protein
MRYVPVLNIGLDSYVRKRDGVRTSVRKGSSHPADCFDQEMLSKHLANGGRVKV